MRVLDDTRTREQLQAAIGAHRAALAEHAQTVGVPAPLADYTVDQLVRTNAEWVLRSEIPIDQPEEIPPTLGDVKTRRLQDMQKARDAQMAAGHEFGGYIFHSDKDAIRDVLMALTGAQMASAPVPDAISWKLQMRQGATTHAPLNLQQLGALFEALTGNMLQIYGREEEKMAAILSAETIEDALAVTW